MTKINERLEYLRGEIRAERMSYGDIAELQSLWKWIDADDVELLEWARPEVDVWKKGTTIKFRTKSEALERLRIKKHHMEFRNVRIKKIEGDKLNRGWVVCFEYRYK